MRSISQLKSDAKATMKGYTGVLICTYIIWAILSGIPLVSFIAAPAMVIGLMSQHLKLANGNPIQCSDSIPSFELILKTFLCILLIAVISAAISIPLTIIWGIIVAIVSATSYDPNMPLLIITLLLYIASFGAGIFIGLSFSQVFFAIADENMGTIEAFKFSLALTKNNKMRIFLLGLSFIPWAFACILILPIFWVVPYQLAAQTQLYLDLKREYYEKGNLL